VYLAKIENKTLIPFECGEYPWDQSAVKVRESLIKNIKYENNIETMVSELKEGSKRFYKGDCILPLRNEHGTWKIDAELERKGPCRLVYSKEKGLEVVRC
jgi:hypothetical protein